LERYLGTYTLTAGARTMDVRVFNENGQLMAQPTGQGVSKLLHQGSHQFVFASDTDIRLAFNLENGRAAGFVLLQNGNSYPGTRKQ